METLNSDMGNQEELQSQANDLSQTGIGPTENPENFEAQDENAAQRKIRHSDHSVSRRYRMFSNHSSANDLPHTNTSF